MITLFNSEKLFFNCNYLSEAKLIVGAVSVDVESGRRGRPQDELALEARKGVSPSINTVIRDSSH